MTADIVNLRRARKAKARADRVLEADQNRLSHGISRHARQSITAERAIAERRLDGAEREPRSLPGVPVPQSEP